MKEITRITTIQITEIEKMDNETADTLTTAESKENYKVNLQRNLKEMLGVDDVKVTNMQDFIRDVDE